ncbi:hypothetical protein BDA99DRAFT_559382 [Phascolomyces articulosus]|uniref:Restriction of telomere capping protein 4 n=1 Tax=Phascolomyces articulosus TaxID=60185 RepID=A0AAD5PEG1_9FUNG|nr:hypothetical protein BDA99DRAFT_559382 [Phascolomyces articulosus]
MFERSTRASSKGKPFNMTTDTDTSLSTKSKKKDLTATNSLNSMMQQNTAPSTTTRHSTRNQKHGSTSQQNNGPIMPTHKRKRNNSKQKMDETPEDDDFQEQQPKTPRRNLSQKKKERSSVKGKNKSTTDEKPPEVAKIPELVIRSSKRKVNGAPSTAEDKRKRKEDQRKKQEEIENLSFSSNLDIDEFMNEQDIGKIDCPFCHTDLGTRKSIPEKVRLALKIIRKKDKQFEQEETERIKQRASTKHAQFLEKRLHIQRKASNMEQYSFCRLHRVEIIVKPEGIKKGYPSSIDFDKLESRIHKIKKDLQYVIDGKVESQFRNMALKSYEEDGVNKARSTMAVMSRFDKTLPGYYGSKGAATILDVLSTLFLHTGNLTIKHTSPQLPLEYVQQVLVPEVGLRLIQQDLKEKDSKNRSSYTMEKAMEKMTESREYGCLVYPVNNEDVGEFTEENFIDLTSSDEEEEEDDDDDSE